MELGLALDLGSEHDSVADRLSVVRSLLGLAEENGFRSVWFGEGYGAQPGSFHLPSSLLMLAAVADSTSMKLGTGVTLLPAWNPLRLAYEAALLDQASGGRLTLGVGIGTPGLWQRFGLPTNRIGDRVDEFLQALRALWRGESGFHGEFVSVDGPVLPLPVQSGGPPLWVGGRVGRSAVRAARYGNGWYAATSYRLSELKRMVVSYRQACSEAAVKPGAVAVNRIVVVTDQPKTVEPYVDALLARYVAIKSILGHDGLPVDAASALALKDELVIVGNADQVRQGLLAYERAGATHLQARVWPSDMPVEIVKQSIRDFGKLLLPN